MKSKKSFNVMFAFCLVFFLTVSSLFSATYYCRPYDSSEDNGDGTAYARPTGGSGSTGCFNGRNNINWAVITSADTLYYCGNFIRDFSSNGIDYWKTEITGTENQWFTERYDYPGDPGIVWGAYKDCLSGGMKAANWVADWDSNTGVYYNETNQWFKAYDTFGLFVYINGPDDYQLYNKVASAQAVIDGDEGDYYMENFGTSQTRIWLRPHNTTTFKDTIRWSGGVGCWCWSLNEGKNYIKYIGLQLKFLNIRHYPSDPTQGPWHHYEFIDGKIKGRWYPYNTHDVVMDGVEFYDGQNGVYDMDVYGDNYNFTFLNCIFKDIGSRDASADGHAIGWQSSNGLTVENCRFENCGSGVVCWLGAATGLEQKNITIKNNLFTGMRYDWCYATPGYAIVLQANNDYVKGQSGDLLIAGNVIMDSVGTGYAQGVGIFSSRKEIAEIYNNLVINCTISYKFSGQRTDGASVDFKNNISLDPREKHIYFYQSCGGSISYSFECDNNLYHPDETGLFYIIEPDAGASNTSADFADWKTAQAAIITSGNNTAGGVVDANSLTSDPLLNDPDNEDFTLDPSSPCINAGTDVGLTEDINGFPIINTPDIGPTEYTSLIYNLIGYYRFEEEWDGTAGEVIDSSGYDNHATSKYDACTTSGAAKLGSYGGSFVQSSYDCIEVPDGSTYAFGTDSFTFAAWVKTTDSDYGRFFNKYKVGSGYYQLTMNGGRIYLVVHGDNGNTISINSTAGGTINDGSWHLAVWTFQNNATGSDTGAVWIDGVKKAEGTADIDDISNTTKLTFPAYRNCNMDEVCIWNRVLTQDEILELYNSGSGRIIK